MRILVTGASGFVGSLLVPRLCAEGHTVRALGREPERVRAALARTQPAGQPVDVEVLRADVLTRSGLAAALDGVEVAYYLIHSMEPIAHLRDDFTERERLAAESFAVAASKAGVRRIVYLGGLLPREDEQAPRLGARPSRHLASRAQVEQVHQQAERA
jgi:uncharacterized protein YbjT (DUF2867 family)